MADVSQPLISDAPQPQAATQGSAGKLWVSPEGELYNAANASESQRFEAMGYRLPTGADIKRSHIKAVYTRDYSAGEAALYGAVEGVPFLGSAITATANALEPGSGDAFVAKSEIAQEQHPYVSTGAKLATGTAAFIGGEGLIGAGLKGAQLLQGSTAVARVANAAVKSGAASALTGAASRADMAIMQHLSGMGGEEKLFAHLGYSALADAAIGAAVPVAVQGVAKAARGVAKAFAGAGEVLQNAEGRKATLALQKIQTAYDAARATDVHQVFAEQGFNKMSQEKVAKAIQDRLPSLEAAYNNMKAASTERLTTAEGNALGQSIKQALDNAGSPELSQDIIRRRLATPEQTLQGLHDLRVELDSKIDYKTPSPSAQDRALFQARQEVGTAIRTLLRDSDIAFGGANAEKWIATDREYSAFQVMQEVLGTEARPVGAFEGLVNKADKRLTELHLVTGLFGLHGLGPHAVMHGAVKAAKKAIDSEALSKSARYLSKKVLEPAADRLTTAVESGLYGVAQDAALTFSAQHSADIDFDNRYAQVQWSVQNPDKAVANLTDSLIEAGADTDLAGQMALRAQAASNYMAQNAPLSLPRGSRLVPSRPGIPTAQKREWMSLYKTIQDPAHGILNPTSKNIAAMQQFYPEQLKATREAILTQIQNSPDLPMQARMYAARVLQQPVDSLTDGFLGSILGEAEAQQQQAQAQMQQTSGARRSNVASSGSAQTRLQRLQED